MEKEHCFYIQLIKERFSKKQRSNSHYSLRAFARDLGINSSTLSHILNDKRSIPTRHVYNIANKLELSPKENALFMQSYHEKRNINNFENLSSLTSQYLIDESNYKVIAEWEHFAVLELFNIKGFKLNVLALEKYFNIAKNRAEVVINNLLTAGLISINENGQYQKTFFDIKTTDGIISRALKESHIETLNLGISKIQEIDIELRDFTSSTLSINVVKIPEAKKLIREFSKKMSALLRDGKESEVYQLAVQLFPLSKINKPIEKGNYHENN